MSHYFESSPAKSYYFSNKDEILSLDEESLLNFLAVIRIALAESTDFNFFTEQDILKVLYSKVNENTNEKVLIILGEITEQLFMFYHQYSNYKYVYNAFDIEDLNKNIFEILQKGNDFTLNKFYMYILSVFLQIEDVVSADSFEVVAAIVSNFSKYLHDLTGLLRLYLENYFFLGVREYSITSESFNLYFGNILNKFGESSVPFDITSFFEKLDYQNVGMSAVTAVEKYIIYLNKYDVKTNLKSNLYYYDLLFPFIFESQKSVSDQAVKSFLKFLNKDDPFTFLDLIKRMLTVKNPFDTHDVNEGEKIINLYYIVCKYLESDYEISCFGMHSLSYVYFGKTNIKIDQRNFKSSFWINNPTECYVGSIFQKIFRDRSLRVRFNRKEGYITATLSATASPPVFPSHYLHELDIQSVLIEYLNKSENNNIKKFLDYLPCSKTIVAELYDPVVFLSDITDNVKSYYKLRVLINRMWNDQTLKQVYTPYRDSFLNMLERNKDVNNVMIVSNYLEVLHLLKFDVTVPLFVDSLKKLLDHSYSVDDSVRSCIFNLCLSVSLSNNELQDILNQYFEDSITSDSFSDIWNFSASNTRSLEADLFETHKINALSNKNYFNCYMNCIIYQLVSIPYFKYKTLNTEFNEEFHKEFQKLIYMLEFSEQSLVDLSKFIEAFQKISPERFKSSTQQDAMDFFYTLIDNLPECLSDIFKGEECISTTGQRRTEHFFSRVFDLSLSSRRLAYDLFIMDNDGQKTFHHTYITKFPDVLIVQSADHSYNKEIEQEIYLASNSKGQGDAGYLYILSGFISYLGHDDGGHYISYVKKEGRWIKLDDSKDPVEIKFKNISCTKNVLFYVKRRHYELYYRNDHINRVLMHQINDQNSLYMKRRIFFSEEFYNFISQFGHFNVITEYFNNIYLRSTLDKGDISEKIIGLIGSDKTNSLLFFAASDSCKYAFVYCRSKVILSVLSRVLVHVLNILVDIKYEIYSDFLKMLDSYPSITKRLGRLMSLATRIDTGDTKLCTLIIEHINSFLKSNTSIDISYLLKPVCIFYEHGMEPHLSPISNEIFEHILLNMERNTNYIRIHLRLIGLSLQNPAEFNEFIVLYGTVPTEKRVKTLVRYLPIVPKDQLDRYIRISDDIMKLGTTLYREISEENKGLVKSIVENPVKYLNRFLLTCDADNAKRRCGFSIGLALFPDLVSNFDCYHHITKDITSLIVPNEYKDMRARLVTNFYDSCFDGVFEFIDSFDARPIDAYLMEFMLLGVSYSSIINPGELIFRNLLEVYRVCKKKELEKELVYISLFLMTCDLENYSDDYISIIYDFRVTYQTKRVFEFISKFTSESKVNKIIMTFFTNHKEKFRHQISNKDSYLYNIVNYQSKYDNIVSQYLLENINLKSQLMIVSKLKVDSISCEVLSLAFFSAPDNYRELVDLYYQTSIDVFNSFLSAAFEYIEKHKNKIRLQEHIQIICEYIYNENMEDQCRLFCRVIKSFNFQLIVTSKVINDTLMKLINKYTSIVGPVLAEISVNGSSSEMVDFLDIFLEKSTVSEIKSWKNSMNKIVNKELLRREVFRLRKDDIEEIFSRI